MADDPHVKALVAKLPLKRRAQPEEIASAVVFLASPLATYVTGATLPVDGGFLLR
jgi:NAD(P)-dependent dehydrogenase (short-subunit alcohol dehydrogenase family)